MAGRTVIPPCRQIALHVEWDERYYGFADADVSIRTQTIFPSWVPT